MLTTCYLLVCAVVCSTAGCPTGYGLSSASGNSLRAVIEVNEAQWIKDRRAAGYGYDKVGPLKAYAPMPVFFEGWKSGPSDMIEQYRWDFGDGSPQMPGFNAAHVYEKPGKYTATLTVIGKGTTRVSSSVTVEVMAPDGKTYYVDSATGNDANDGLAPERAWKTATMAFQGMGNRRYGPGDRILFKRGRTYTIAVGDVKFNPYKHGYGYHFGAYGSGSKPLVQLVGPTSGCLLNDNALGYFSIGFVDLAFNLTSTEGAVSDFIYTRGGTSNSLFLRVDLTNFHQGFISSHTDGVFVVSCTARDSLGIQTYSKSSRVAILNSELRSSGSHIAYLSGVHKGVIYGSQFIEPHYGRCGLRIAHGSDIYVANNLISGRPGDREDRESQYTWLLVQFAPNTPEAMSTDHLLFEYNTVENADTLLNLGSVSNATIRHNVFRAAFAAGGGGAIMVGSKHGFDLKGCEDVVISDNTIELGKPLRGNRQYAFYVRGKSCLVSSVRPVGDVAVHRGIDLSNNDIYLENDRIHALAFDLGELNQQAQVDYAANSIHIPVPDRLFPFEGEYLNLENWLSVFPGDGSGTHVTIMQYTPIGVE